MHCTNCNETIDNRAEICPKCGVRTFTVKNYCQECGTSVMANQELCVKCGTTLAAPKQTIKSNYSYSPLLMGIASFFIPGLGQMIMGQVKKGLVLLAISLFLGLVTFGIIGFILMIVATVDAVKIAKKLQAGRAVEEWEFF